MSYCVLQLKDECIWWWGYHPTPGFFVVVRDDNKMNHREILHPQVEGFKKDIGFVAGILTIDT
jgi:hypothetical protein